MKLLYLTHFNHKFTFCKKNEFISNIEMLCDIFADETSLKVLWGILNNFFYIINGNEDEVDYHSIYDTDHYFQKNLFNVKDGFTFVDCGAFNGDTLLSLLDCEYADKLKKYYCYEMDGQNFLKLERTIQGLDLATQNKIQAYKLGLGSENQVLKYNFNSGRTCFCENGKKEVKVVNLSEHLKDVPVTFIKMDVEGAELEVLKGGVNSLRKISLSLLFACITILFTFGKYRFISNLLFLNIRYI